MASSIASRWSELSGDQLWKDLLNPLDLDLRRYVIHYLQRAGAAGDAFNKNKASKGHAFSLFPPEDFFAGVGLEKGNPYRYKLTNFIYAAADSDHSVFIGYVAVSTDEGKAALGRRDILVSWRGSMTAEEWEKDFKIEQTSAKELFGTDDVKVRKAVQELVDEYQNEVVSITTTGHSLGGALAALNAMDIAANGWNKPTSNPHKSFMVTAFPSGCPRIGNLGFRLKFDELVLLKHLRLLRIVNSKDIVPNVPLVPGIYFQVAENHVLKIDTTKSPYLKSGANAHSFEVYQHGVAGVQENGEFKIEEQLDFDNSVVNKYSDDLLQDEYKIPDSWWTNEKFKNMVQNEDGHWEFVDSYYVPPPPTV